MGWIIAGAAMVPVAALASLWGSWHRRRDLATGAPTFASLADYTGIYDRQVLERLAGPPNADGRYHLPAGCLASLPQAAWKRHFDSDALDGFCVLGGIAAIALQGSHRGWSLGLVAACGLYQLVSWGHAIWVVARSSELERD